jgi:predicted RNase H-like nuclease (RuvC/YqgF family)
MTIYEALKQDIKKLNRELKNEEEIFEILKRRLTKKEYKYYMMKLEGLQYDALKSDLNVDSERLMSIARSVNKKINSEKIKYELSIKV